MKSPEGKSTIAHKKEHQDHKPGPEQAEDHDHKSSSGQTSGPHKQRRISQYSKDAPNQVRKAKWHDFISFRESNWTAKAMKKPKKQGCS